MPGITDGLDLFPSVSPSPGRSLGSHVERHADRFGPKTEYLLLSISTTADARLTSATQALVFSREGRKADGRIVAYSCESVCLAAPRL